MFRNQSKKNILFLIIFILLLLLAVVIYKLRQKGNVDELKESAVTSITSTEVIENQNKIPDYFPADFPIPPNSVLTDSWSVEKIETKGLSLVFESDESPQTLFDFYKNKLTELGWKVESGDREQSQILIFEKDNISGFLGITPKDGTKTNISVTMGIE